MIANKYFILALLMLCVAFGHAQSTIDNVVSTVATNNKTIQANRQYWEARKLQFQTGITPSDPTVQYDYMQGKPSSAGNQTDFSVAQALDFPTTYIKKRQLADEQIAQADFEMNVVRQNVLLEAKQICISLVFRNKLNVELVKRKQDHERHLLDFQEKLDKGDGNILDVNKAKLQLIEINRDFQENGAAFVQLTQQLASLNGGVAIIFNDTLYPLPRIVPAFDQLQLEYETIDPLRKSLEHEKLIAQKQVEVSKSLWLPKLEAGYHYQGILGQTYSGVHTGISIPLWENKNTVKLQKANVILADLNLQDHINKHYYEIKQLYERYLQLRQTLEDYRSVMSSLNSSFLLNKALSLGEITAIEYYMEMTYFKNAYRSYLETEEEFNEVITQLFKYQL